MLLGNDGPRTGTQTPARTPAPYPEHTPRGTFVFTAESRLLSALGRATYAFMCLRWEALWLHGALAGRTDAHPGELARATPAVLGLRLQAAVADRALDAPLRGELTKWVDAFAASSDLHEDLLRAHPGADSLWSLPTDTPERLTLADRPEDLLDHAHRFEALALEGANLRRAL